MDVAGGPDQVLSYLYIGGAYDAMPRILDRIGITHILNLKGGSYALAGKYNLKILPISDFGTQDLSQMYEKCFDFIGHAKLSNGKILVHCQGGMNRSATIVLAYLVAKENWTLKQAHQHLKAKRPIISPHELYWKQLRDLEVKLTGKLTLSEEEIGPTLQQQMREFLQQQPKDLS